jgi:hypothetical protein
MESREQHVRVLELLGKIVDAVARLFEAYSRAFPEHTDFWFGMAMEEVDHSNLVHECIGGLKRGRLHVSTEGFDTEAMQALLDRVESELERARRGPIELRDALRIALDIQKTVIEGEYLDLLGYYCIETERPGSYPPSTARSHVKAVESFLEEVTGEPPG